MMGVELPSARSSSRMGVRAAEIDNRPGLPAVRHPPVDGEERRLFPTGGHATLTGPLPPSCRQIAVDEVFPVLQRLRKRSLAGLPQTGRCRHQQRLMRPHVVVLFPERIQPSLTFRIPVPLTYLACCIRCMRSIFPCGSVDDRHAAVNQPDPEPHDPDAQESSVNPQGLAAFHHGVP